MSGNLAHCMSPVNIGLDLDPTWPKRNAAGADPASSSTVRRVEQGKYRTNNGLKTLEAGDLVRFGDWFGVVEVDHQNKLVGANEMPVVNFGLNVWYFNNIRKTNVGGFTQPIGSIVYWRETRTDMRDYANTKEDAHGVVLEARDTVPVRGYHTPGDTVSEKAWYFGMLLDEMPEWVLAYQIYEYPVRVLMGGSVGIRVFE